MKVSIIVPFYNREKTAARCLESLLASTYENLEIIAVDDGSVDGTVAILHRFAAADPRVKVVCQENAGPSAARNRGLDEASGDFVAFCDSDDWVDPTIYEKLLAEQRKSDADIVISGFYCSYEDGRNFAQRVAAGNSTSSAEIQNNVIRHFYDGDSTGLPPLWNKLYKKAMLDCHRLRFNEKIHRAEDWWLNMQAYECAECVSIIKEPLYYYMQDSSDSLMKKMKAEYYWQWKEAKTYLVRKNEEQYHFDVDLDRFYQEQLFTIHTLLIHMSANGEAIDEIINDDFYNEIIQYDRLTSAPVKLCHKLHRISKRMEKLAYKCLAAYYGR